MSLWQEVAGLAAKVPPKKKKCQDEASEEEKHRKRNAKRALAMAGEGQFTRAIQALTIADMAEKSRATVKLLRDKHPAPSLPPGPLPTTDSDPLTLYGPDVYKAALKFKKGTAAGPSGLRPEHLRVVQGPAVTYNQVQRCLQRPHKAPQSDGGRQGPTRGRPLSLWGSPSCFQEARWGNLPHSCW